jgi:hypothetical protein
MGGFHTECIRVTRAMKTRESQEIVSGANNAGTPGTILRILRDCSK